MARAVFSAELAHVNNAAPVGDHAFAPTDGDTWVIHTIDALGPTGRTLAIAGFFVWGTDFSVIWDRTLGVRGSTPYHWEGRQVIEPGTTLFVTTLFAGWSVRASGYNLTPT